jgi:hypothetical protein
LQTPHIDHSPQNLALLAALAAVSAGLILFGRRRHFRMQNRESFEVPLISGNLIIMVGVILLILTAVHFASSILGLDTSKIRGRGGM